MKVFIEKQRFNQWWLFVLLISSLIIVLIPFLFSQVDLIYDKETVLGSTISFIIMLMVIILILSIRLKTRIDEKGFYYQFFPFNLKQKFISWSNIKACRLRRYKPIKEYGGWGFRTGFGRGYGKALNIKGKKGIQLEFKDGKKLLLGTQKEKEVEKVLATYIDKTKNF